MRLITIPFAAFLVGCSTLPSTVDLQLKEAWLVGPWIPAGTDCESDAGISFGSDRSWVAYNAAGTWKLEDRILVLLTTHHWDSGGEWSETLTEVQSDTEIIEVTGPDSYRWYWGRREAIEMRRCRPSPPSGML